jgi:hypothetical protein
VFHHDRIGRSGRGLEIHDPAAGTHQIDGTDQRWKPVGGRSRSTLTSTASGFSSALASDASDH